MEPIQQPTPTAGHRQTIVKAIEAAGKPLSASKLARALKDATNGEISLLEAQEQVQDAVDVGAIQEIPSGRGVAYRLPLREVEKEQPDAEAIQKAAEELLDLIARAEAEGCLPEEEAAESREFAGDFVRDQNLAGLQEEIRNLRADLNHWREQGPREPVITPEADDPEGDGETRLESQAFVQVARLRRWQLDLEQEAEDCNAEIRELQKEIKAIKDRKAGILESARAKTEEIDRLLFDPASLVRVPSTPAPKAIAPEDEEDLPLPFEN